MHEHYERVQSMVKDDGSTWDLSPNDKAALRHILDLVIELAEEVAAYKGIAIPTTIEMFSELVAANHRQSAAT